MTDQAEFLSADALAAMSGISHAFFTTRGGVSGGIYESLNAGLGSDDDRANVVENRRRMAAALGSERGDIASPYQVHSPDVVVVSDLFTDERPKADGIVTTTPNLPIGIVTADCGPVLFADEKAGVIGACHAGWGGALKGVLENTIETMEGLGANRADIRTVLGPTISHANYEVGPNFPAPFIERDANAAKHFTPSKNAGHHMFDLPAYIVERLSAAGVAGSALPVCTYAGEDQFYSYRRTTHKGGGDYGRQMSAIMLRGD
ncbi:peptidoglycan editing factor PgeF [Pseudahrensia aquimaris]|uniref:Purine nucleoside phosphorylase n=1 Tax=Pseudahrensia aquimaris TaxID=744461 RepID=A0ABW3FEM7_9HYPH